MTRIEKDWNFNAAVHFDGKFIINNYDLTVSMMVETESNHEQNVAMERLDYFINNILDSCIFISNSETKSIEIACGRRDPAQKSKTRIMPRVNKMKMKSPTEY